MTVKKLEKLISVICPVYNEKTYIQNLLSFFVRVKPDEKELIIIDGGSTDGTIEIVESWCQKYSCIKLINNVNRTVPYALNMGIKASKGNIIIRIDAHTDYANDYFEKIISTFNEVNTDVVGGPTRVASGSHFQNAVALAISSPLGIGNSKVHDFNFRGYTDHVTFGAWKREIFDDIGFFDVRLIRNQDDEFHYRAKSKGKKIYLNPDIKLWYHPRKNFFGLFRQYFQYGYYKPLVLQKIKSEIKIRHLIPSLFVIYLLTLPFSFFFSLWVVPLMIYFFAILITIISAKINLIGRLYSLIVYPAIHIAYGSGFLLRLFNMKAG